MAPLLSKIATTLGSGRSFVVAGSYAGNLIFGAANPDAADLKANDVDVCTGPLVGFAAGALGWMRGEHRTLTAADGAEAVDVNIIRCTDVNPTQLVDGADINSVALNCLVENGPAGLTLTWTVSPDYWDWVETSNLRTLSNKTPAQTLVRAKFKAFQYSMPLISDLVLCKPGTSPSGNIDTNNYMMYGSHKTKVAVLSTAEIKDKATRRDDVDNPRKHPDFDSGDLFTWDDYKVATRGSAFCIVPSSCSCGRAVNKNCKHVLCSVCCRAGHSDCQAHKHAPGERKLPSSSASGSLGNWLLGSSSKRATALPPGWKQYASAAHGNKLYYHHKSSGVTSWVFPGNPGNPPGKPPGKPPSKHDADDGQHDRDVDTDHHRDGDLDDRRDDDDHQDEDDDHHHHGPLPELVDDRLFQAHGPSNTQDSLGPREPRLSIHALTTRLSGTDALHLAPATAFASCCWTSCC